MKQHKKYGFAKAVGNTGFYTIIAVCLIALGAATWFAVSKYNTVTRKDESAEKPKSYTSDTPSYNNSTPPVSEEAQPQNTDVAKEVSDIPYSSDTESENEAEEQPAKSFVMPAIGNVSKGYSDTTLQFSNTYGDMRIHDGIDIVCEAGTEIVSASSGTVISVADDTAYGKTVKIDHGDGIVALYCGFGGVAVSDGDKVATGDTLGTLGSIPCECADQSHLHITVSLDGKTVSPLDAFGLN